MIGSLRHAAWATGLSATIAMNFVMNGAAFAQTPPAAPSPATPPAAASPATPPAATTPPPAPGPTTATPPAPTPETPAPVAPPVVTSPADPAKAETKPDTKPDTKADTKPADPFGEENTLTARKVVALKGTANWDSAFETLTNSFKTLVALLDKQAVKPSGSFLIVYNSTDDTGFTYQAEIPIDGDLKNLPKDVSVTKSPEGKTLKFVHRGSYDNMDNTYEAITNHLDDKKLEAKDTFIEEYVTDPLKTAEDKLIINVFVPLK